MLHAADPTRRALANRSGFARIDKNQHLIQGVAMMLRRKPSVRIAAMYCVALALASAARGARADILMTFDHLTGAHWLSKLPELDVNEQVTLRVINTNLSC